MATMSSDCLIDRLSLSHATDLVTPADSWVTAVTEIGDRRRGAAMVLHG
jgi:hypothetical protein